MSKLTSATNNNPKLVLTIAILFSAAYVFPLIAILIAYFSTESFAEDSRWFIGFLPYMHEGNTTISNLVKGIGCLTAVISAASFRQRRLSLLYYSFVAILLCGLFLSMIDSSILLNSENLTSLNSLTSGSELTQIEAKGALNNYQGTLLGILSTLFGLKLFNDK